MYIRGNSIFQMDVGRWGKRQRDQMSRLFLNIWPFPTMYICRKEYSHFELIFLSNEPKKTQKLWIFSILSKVVNFPQIWSHWEEHERSYLGEGSTESIGTLPRGFDWECFKMGQYQCRDWNPRSLEHEFPPITTRPGLAP